MTHCETGYTQGLYHMKQHREKQIGLKKWISETAVLISIFKAHWKTEKQGDTQVQRGKCSLKTMCMVTNYSMLLFSAICIEAKKGYWWCNGLSFILFATTPGQPIKLCNSTLYPFQLCLKHYPTPSGHWEATTPLSFITSEPLNP